MTPGRLSPRRAIVDNFAAIETLQALQTSGAEPSPAEREVLGGWHGWGAAPQLFDRPEFGPERERLRKLLGARGFDAAARTTLNAHYTDTRLVKAMWASVATLGISGGVFLEPGCGRGAFLAGAPAGFAGVGVELDPTTAAVASLLAGPAHEVVAGDFARIELRRGSLDLVIGNVPFGNYPVYDPEFNPASRLPIHDHFIVKSLAALAAGGVALVVTSRYSLDKLDAIARRSMGEQADFLGAVRLPSSAHRAAAGTEVVTDVLVFRARAEGAAPCHASGFLSAPEQLGESGGSAYVSRYFVEHPEQVLGEVRIEHGQYGASDLVVHSEVPPGEGLAEALERVASASPEGSPPSPGARRPDPVVVQRVGAEAPIGRIEQTPVGFRRYGPEGWERHEAGNGSTELARLVQIRDLARSLVELETWAPVDSEVLEARRAELAGRYRTYVSRHGPINRVTINPETGRRTWPRLSGFRSDPDFPRVAALELYDESTGSARPAALLERRVVLPAEPVTHAESPADALGLSLAELGRVDLDLIAGLLGIERDRCLEALGELVFVDPTSEQVVTRDEYLSGNVRRKLAEARAVAEGDPAYLRNVEALGGAQPRDITADELERVIGAPWVPVETVRAFACHLAPPGSAVEEISVARSSITNEWVIDAPRRVRERLGKGHPFGTSSRDALDLLVCCLNGKTPVVTVETEDGRRVVDAEATAIACDRAEELREEFDRWLLHDEPTRAKAMLELYNERFNAYVPRSFAGVRVSAPGLASSFDLRPHQHQAIARIIYQGNTGLWHPVGAGKSAVMVVAGQEMRRLGIVRRPLYVVPNHMLEQFAADIVRLYPAAEVLAVSRDEVSPRSRHLFAARLRSHDWDAVVITHSSFVRWSLSATAEAEMVAEKIAGRRKELAEGMGDRAADRTLTKRLEKSIARYEATLQALQAKIASHQDQHDFPFDQSGVDFVMVDEADEFKNGELYSMAGNLRGVPAGEGSQRAVDLDRKLRWMRREHPERQIVHSTGTPVSNVVSRRQRQRPPPKSALA